MNGDRIRRRSAGRGPGFFLALRWLTAVAPLLVAGVAEAATVLLVRPTPPSAVATEAIVRLQGELVAGGFDVTVIDQPPGEDVRRGLELAVSGDAVALVAIRSAERTKPPSCG